MNVYYIVAGLVAVAVIVLAVSGFPWALTVAYIVKKTNPKDFDLDKFAELMRACHPTHHFSIPRKSPKEKS
ncbi:MAG: hypothetical protein LBN10_07445 [Propionibacteriaceae bacterium]|jgi:hypothetical protein|nr:hypothetical protein [Propionibacteriaceae bacterium]